VEELKNKKREKDR
jgi:hypothetical protein